ncbi:hypothetical protein ACSTD9_03440 [Vibrio vulnificus]|uniref:hypothetical protein n=1 Tax=Vibrio vulnificus TaxID=672 RepID=UPI003ED9B2BE
MKSSLSEEMKSNIKNAVIDQDMAFKYSPAYDIHSVSREPADHRVMCKGPKTQNKWVWLGNAKGIYSFDSPAQARLFVKELKAELLSRKGT